MDEPENGGSSIFCCTESVKPAADWTVKNTIDICLLTRTKNVSFQPYLLLRITHDMTMNTFFRQIAEGQTEQTIYTGIKYYVM